MHSGLRARAAGALFVVVALSGALSGCDWAQFRNGPDRTGFVQKSVVESAGIPGLVQKWSAATGGPVQSSPVVAAGIAYVGSDDGHLYAYDAVTGAPRWNRDTSAAIVAAPAVANGVVFVGSADHTVRAFAASDGTPKWSHPMPTTFGGPGASPAVVGSRVFVSSDDRIYALNVNDGSEAWSAASGLTGPLSAPAVANNLVYATSYSDGTVVAFHADDGSPVWTTTAPGTRSNCPAVLPSPAVSSGVVYAVVCPSRVTGGLAPRARCKQRSDHVECEHRRVHDLAGRRERDGLRRLVHTEGPRGPAHE